MTRLLCMYRLAVLVLSLHAFLSQCHARLSRYSAFARLLIALSCVAYMAGPMHSPICLQGSLS